MSMRLRALVPALAAFAVLAVTSRAAAQAGPATAAAPASPDTTTSDLARLDQFEMLRAPVVGQPVTVDSAFVARAIADRSFSLTLGATSGIDNDRFPLTLQVSPFLWSSQLLAAADQETGFAANLRQSTVAVQYVPLIVQRKPGQTNLSSSSDRKGSVTYSLPLVGLAPPQAFSDEIRARLARVLPPPGPEPLTPEQLAALTKAAKEARDLVTAEYSRFALTGTATYTWDTRNDKPNSASATLLGSKVLTPLADVLRGTGSVWTLNASAGGTWFQRVGTSPSFSRASGGLDLDLQLPSTLILSLAPSLDHYSGSGYAAIVGGSDTRRQDDFTLKQSVTFKIPGFTAAGNKLAISVAEEHLGTPQHDVAINFAVNMKLPPFAADIKPGRP